MKKDNLQQKEPLDIYTIYDHPSDYPDHYVIRKHRVRDGQTNVDPFYFVQSKDLQMLRNHLVAELGLTLLPPDPNDDPVILEVYI